MKNKLILSFFILSLAISFSSCSDDNKEIIPTTLKKIPLFYKGYWNGEMCISRTDNIWITYYGRPTSVYEMHHGYLVGISGPNSMIVRAMIWDPRFDKSIDFNDEKAIEKGNKVDAVSFDKNRRYKLVEGTYETLMVEPKLGYALEDDCYFKGLLNVRLVNIKDPNDEISLVDVEIYFYSGDRDLGHDLFDEEYLNYIKYHDDLPY